MTNTTLFATKTVNGNGNRIYVISEKLAEKVNKISSIFPSTGKEEKSPYPYEIGVPKLCVFLQLSSLFTDADLEYFKEERVLEDEETPAYDKDVHDFILDIKTYLFRSQMAWLDLESLDRKEIPFDWFYAYLVSLTQGETGTNFAFLSRDDWGPTIVPIEILRIDFQSASLLQPFDCLDIRYRRYLPYSKEEVCQIRENVSVPIGETVNLEGQDEEEFPFTRVVDLEALAQRNLQIESLFGKSVELPEKLADNSRSKHMAIMRGKPVLVKSSGRYLINPEVIEEEYSLLDHAKQSFYVKSKKSIPDYQPWWLSRDLTAFSIDRIDAVIIPGDLVHETQYDKTRINKVLVTEDQKIPVLALANAANTGTLYSDPVRDFTSCLVLLQGQPGTGKTSFCISVADFFEKPLIHVTIGQINVHYIASTLERLFRIAHVFGAYVLLDEADVLLYQRDINNLERSKIVTEALGSLENFNGVVFLTSNVPESEIDSAVRSRITKLINFPKLSKSTVAKIWQLNMSRIGVSLSSEDLSKLVEARPEIDGRQIVAHTRVVSAMSQLYSQNGESGFFDKSTGELNLDQFINMLDN